MPASVAWNNSTGGAFDGARQFIHSNGLAFGPGVRLGRVQLGLTLLTGLGTSSGGAPTTAAAVVAGLRLLPAGSTPSVSYPANPGLDWLAVEELTAEVVPRSTANGWDLVHRTRGTIERVAPRVTTAPAGVVLWLICSAVAVPQAGGVWTGFADVRVQYSLA